MPVFDSSPLRYLARAGKLGLIEAIHGEKIVPEAVFREVVVVGKEKGKRDASAVEALFNRGVMDVVRVGDSELLHRLENSPGLSRADAEVTVLARGSSATAIIDDEFARRVASSLNVRVHGTIYPVLRLLKEGKISGEEAESTIEGMIKQGFRCSAELYGEIMRKIRDLHTL